MPRRFLRKFTVLALSLLLLSGVLVTTGCKKKTAEDRLKEAQQLLAERQTPLAVLKIKDLITEFPDDPVVTDARMALAQIYLQLGRKENIQNAVEQLQAIHDKLGFGDDRGYTAYQGIIDITARTGDLPKALELAKAGAEKTKDNQKLHDELMFVAHNLQLASPDEATQKEGLEGLRTSMLEGADPAARGIARETLAQYLREKKDYLGSNEIYQASLDKYPDEEVNAQLLMAMGVNYKMAEQPDKAGEAFNKGAELMSKQIEEELNLNNRAQKISTLAVFHETMGDLAKSEELLRRIMAEQPATRTAIDAQFEIVRLYIRHDKLDETKALLEQIRKENSTNQIAQTAQQWLQELEQQRAQLEEMKKAATNAGDGATSPTTSTAP